jgi:hypothetical protein
MAKMKVTPAMRGQLQRRRQDWIARVSALVDQVTKWSAAESWSVERHPKTITEELLGTYTVPEIVIRLQGGELILTPVALHVAGGNGRVDLEAIPTLARVKLLGADGGWTLYADPNVPLRLRWNQANFTQLAHDLLG